MLERAQQSVDTLFVLFDTRPTSNDAAITVVPVHSLMIWPNIYLYRSLQILRVQTIHLNCKHTYISLARRSSH